jgi:hypothetical protein
MGPPEWEGSGLDQGGLGLREAPQGRPKRAFRRDEAVRLSGRPPGLLPFGLADESF